MSNDGKKREFKDENAEKKAKVQEQQETEAMSAIKAQVAQTIKLPDDDYHTIDVRLVFHARARVNVYRKNKDQYGQSTMINSYFVRYTGSDNRITNSDPPLQPCK